MSVTPVEPVSCWPVDTRTCDGFTEHEQWVQDLATMMAGQTMRMLTAYSVGACPIKVRPCSMECAAASPAWRWMGGTFVPLNFAGVWSNVACGCGSGSCDHGIDIVTLPGLVTDVDEVRIDGSVLAASKYRVDNGNQLVRTDGSSWPRTQNMAADDTVTGTFSVTYRSGPAVDTHGAIAAGVLACQFAEALIGGKCELPTSVVNVVRQGITYSRIAEIFKDGRTGLLVVDSYLLRVNPHALKEQASIYSPDTPGPRVTSWLP